MEKNKTIGKPSAKTIQEDIGYWTRILSKEELVSMPINKITLLILIIYIRNGLTEYYT